MSLARTAGKAGIIIQDHSRNLGKVYESTGSKIVRGIALGDIRRNAKVAKDLALEAGCSKKYANKDARNMVEAFRNGRKLTRRFGLGKM